jgi:hypothetical protein
VETLASALVLLALRVEAPYVSVVEFPALVEAPVVAEVPTLVAAALYHMKNHHHPSYSWWISSDSTTTVSFSVVLFLYGSSHSLEWTCR